MKLGLSALFSLVLVSGVLSVALEKRANPAGIDVSDFQTNVNWATVKANGIQFAYVKATEGTTFISNQFAQQYNGAFNQGIIRGAYHFAHPDTSTGAAQASFFVAHGGGWSADGLTLPGTLDIETNPNGATCYGLSTSAMVSWISSFVNEYHSLTTRFPVIYTTTSWWNQCTGSSTAFAANSPLWIAHFTTASSPGALPAGWSVFTFWQFADSGTNPGDADTFNGAFSQLQKIALG
ncbi:glycoside hydrolase family 25 protein [Sistotremastrum suecicum HHB10207 ss-3]|uniref:N,O-diacetylmuramidase n=1 Tax=Sistotremastrum suecicum HHB10207 ss-3 TaxID=1314776 RepID=A0A166CK24_9AGAM|nr:glycoside hydrolase family 25 protein [Sistotremastrum suecicum HHB10207 ss-3]